MIITSFTLMQAIILGEIRFEEVLRKVGLSKRSPTFRRHKAIAENAGRLLSIAHMLPDDAAVLSQVAQLNEELFRDFVQSRRSLR
jgi:hypothetical protein